MNAIDADRLMKFVDKFDEFYKQTNRYITGKGLRYVIGKFPVVEAEPVRHGRWIHTDNGDMCSACGCGMVAHFANATIPIQLSNNAYCHNCGTKMDLEEEEDETN